MSLIIDFETKKREEDHIDYYIPKIKKIASFILKNGKVEIKVSEMVKKDVIPKEIKTEIKTEIDSLWQRVDDAMKENNVSNNILKMIAIVQNIDEVNIWNITCMLSGLSIAKVHLDDKDSSTLKFEKLNLIDFSSKGLDKKPDYVQ